MKHLYKLIEIIEIALILYLAYMFYRGLHTRNLGLNELLENTMYVLFGIGFLEIPKIFRKEL